MLLAYLRNGFRDQRTGQRVDEYNDEYDEKDEENYFDDQTFVIFPNDVLKRSKRCHEPQERAVGSSGQRQRIGLVSAETCGTLGSLLLVQKYEFGLQFALYFREIMLEFFLGNKDEWMNGNLRPISFYSGQR